MSFWLPGQFASFAAVPGDPGWAVGAVYYHADVSAGGSKEFVIGGNLAAGIDGRADLVFLAPSYTFKDPVGCPEPSFRLEPMAFGAAALGQLSSRRR